MRRIELNVAGMTCSKCVQRVTSILEGISGVSEASVSLDSSRAEIVADEGVQPEFVAETVTRGGYEATLRNQ